MKTLVLATIPNFDLTNKRRFMSITSLTPFLPLICPILLLQGCDFFEPISKQPSHDIDTRLLGKWDAVVGTKADGEEIHYSVTVTKKDSTHYFIQTNIGKAIAWHNTVGSTDFLLSNSRTRRHRMYMSLARLTAMKCIAKGSAKTQIQNLPLTKKVPSLNG